MIEEAASTLLRELFASWAPPLLRYALRACGRLELAEDLVQEAFLALYRELRFGKEPDSPKAWTIAVVRNQLGKVYRERQHWESCCVLEDLPAMAAPSTLPPDWSEAMRLFAVLTPREEEVVLLRAQDLKYQEIAAQLGISQSSVGVLLTRALKKLRRAAQEGESRAGNTIGLGPHVRKSPQ